MPCPPCLPRGANRPKTGNNPSPIQLASQTPVRAVRTLRTPPGHARQRAHLGPRDSARLQDVAKTLFLRQRPRSTLPHMPHERLDLPPDLGFCYTVRHTRVLSVLFVHHPLRIAEINERLSFFFAQNKSRHVRKTIFRLKTRSTIDFPKNVRPGRTKNVRHPVRNVSIEKCTGPLLPSGRYAAPREGVGGKVRGFAP